MNPGAFGLFVDIHSILRLGHGLPVPSKLAQNPAQLPHNSLDVNTFVSVAMRELGTPHDNVAILQELDDHIEGLVIEELHALVFTVAKV